MENNNKNKKKKFRLDEKNGKILGVLAGLSNYLEFDVTVITIIALAILIASKDSAIIFLYLFVGLIAPKK